MSTKPKPMVTWVPNGSDSEVGSRNGIPLASAWRSLDAAPGGMYRITIMLPLPRGTGKRFEASRFASLEEAKVMAERIVRAWLRHTHRVPRREAGRLAAAAAWLGEHPAVAERLAAGDLLLEHADAMRRVSQRTPRRREAFAEFEGLLIEAALHADADRFAQIMAAWGDAVDAQGADDDADAAHGRRRVHLAPVADGWDLRGWLPAALGAELAGILNEYLSRSRRDEPDAAARTPAAARRADALLDLARAAAAADLPAAARARCRHRLQAAPGDERHGRPDGPTEHLGEAIRAAPALRGRPAPHWSDPRTSAPCASAHAAVQWRLQSGVDPGAGQSTNRGRSFL